MPIYFISCIMAHFSSVLNIGKVASSILDSSLFSSKSIPGTGVDDKLSLEANLAKVSNLVSLPLSYPILVSSSSSRLKCMFLLCS